MLGGCSREGWSRVAIFVYDCSDFWLLPVWKAFTPL